MVTQQLTTNMSNQTKRKLILIIDDDPTVSEAIGSFLKESCFDVISETNAEKAVRLARHMLVDLVILDLHMPKLDGVEVLRMLREQQPKLKVIILSGKLAAYEPKLKSLKVDRMMPKPPDIPILLRTIDELTETIAFQPEFDERASLPKAKILIVDDEIEYCELVSDFLRTFPKAKFEVEFAVTGLEGIEKATFFEPDFVLLDWKMPHMRGDEFLKKINEMEDWAPKQLCVITASDLLAHERSMLPQGTVLFRKPFDLEKLCEFLCTRCLDLGLVD